ncbi:MAG: 2-oxoacid:acceptor oxidoreductase family protein, partial [Clostridia bacterium]|nr:2-oxoacid:acceptor oxidoreductase family protein [Clostridia bacterium]
MTTRFIFAGSGGQGIQFSGKQTAKTGMHVGLNVTFLPSYGPEMRGGTSNCAVVISDGEIGSPS